jgi:hypothetical protein
MFTLWRAKKHGILENVRHSAFGRKVLVSGVARPFLKPLNLKHNNQTEAVEMADVFHELGYQVDVINHDRPMAIDYANYDVLFGWGVPFENLYLRETTRFPRTILYMPGAPAAIANAAGLRRLEAVYRRRGVWLPQSARLWPMGIGFEAQVDGIIALGNAVNAEPWRALTGRPVHELPLFYLPVLDPEEMLRSRDLARTRRHFLWFAGTGLVHKGLDLVLEAFGRHPELDLHVYGRIDLEPGFVRAFHRELRELPNIHVGGYLGLGDPGFRAALLESAFVICPSCSEASCSSILNICGNGGQVPLLTRACGIDLGDFGVVIRDTSVEAVEAALAEATALSDAELERRTRGSAAFFAREHRRELYHQRLKEAIQAILASAVHPGGQPQG